MSNDPILLFLHGVGEGDKDDRWMVRLGETLSRLGFPDLNSIQVIAPKYAHALKAWDEAEPLPPVTVKHPPRELAKQNRRDFERRMGAIESRLGRHDSGKGSPGGDVVTGLSLRHSKFLQARNYLEDDQIRAQVLNRILAKLPPTGRIVIVGHSLGSVIAADLVRRLPVGLDIVGMVTIGSPLAHVSFDVGKLREALKEPPTNLSWWVNYWNALDPVAAHRGVSSAFPWMIDFRIKTETSPIHAHDAEDYLGNEAVVEAVGFALFGSKSTALVSVENGMDIPLDAAEQLALLALRYAHLTKIQLAGDLQDRWVGALRKVQAAAIEGIRVRNEREGRGLPSPIARLALDYSDPHAAAPEPLPSSHISKDEAVVLLTVLAAENVIRPFEIGVPREKRQRAMEDLTAEMGLGSQFGTDVFAAAKRAQDALGGGLGVNWMKWGALGAGAVAIVVATGGLAFAAAPGLAGAAVITSALASFGPGGMIGGLLTAGTLVTAGGGGIAFSLASPGTSAETLETVVSRRLTAEILRQRQHLDPDPDVWGILAATEIEVRREHERLDEFSDESAPALKALKRKIDAIERAMKYLSDNGLEPGVAAPTRGKSDWIRDRRAGAAL